jgi:hypothetical protein
VVAVRTSLHIIAADQFKSLRDCLSIYLSIHTSRSTILQADIAVVWTAQALHCLVLTHSLTH